MITGIRMSGWTTGRKYRNKTEWKSLNKKSLGNVKVTYREKNKEMEQELCC